ncbi:hypothetical protein WJR50_24095 [Catalinimonas sp. 4WD22]|uniref:hypothetical protein n=1 Tax=Catalinimonas locisalis TaxID=3133978 RepID=UPI003100CB06
MKKLFNLFIITLTLLTFHNAYSQTEASEASIITQDADTLKGYVYFSRESQFMFADKMDQEGKALSPDQVKTIILNQNEVFESKEIEVNDEVHSRFLQLLAEGDVNLYKLHDNREFAYWAEDSDGNIYALSNVKLESKRDGKSYIRYTNTYKGVLKNIFSNQPALYASIDRLKYADEALINLFQKYHQQSALPFEVYYSKEKDITFELGVLAGMQFTSIGFSGTEVMTDLLSPDFTNSGNFGFGLFSDIKPSFLGKRSSFRIEMRYHHSSNTNGEMTLSMNNLKVPFAYQYQILPHAKLIPYLSFGPALNFMLSLNDQSNIDRLDNNWLRSGNVQYGLEASAGTAWAINENSHLFLEVKFGLFNGNHLTVTEIYEAGVGYVPAQDSYVSISKSLGIFAGFRF